MMKTYLGDEEEALDGFEFLAMAEAGELCHWEIVEKMAARSATSRSRSSRTGPSVQRAMSRPCASLATLAPKRRTEMAAA